MNREEAVARAKEAERLLGDDARHLGLKWHVLASAYRLAGDLAQAEKYYKRALEVLKKRRQWREASAVAREWGRLLREEGRQEEALDLMEQTTLLGIRDYGRNLRTREAR